MKSFVPRGFDPPEEYAAENLTFRRLTPNYAKIDYEAVMKARGHIRELYGITDEKEWPQSELTIEEDTADLRRHDGEFERREAFAYTVLSPDGRECLGCVYIEPLRGQGRAAEVTLWGIDRALSQKIYEQARIFIDREFPFEKAVFPVFEAPEGQSSGHPFG